MDEDVLGAPIRTTEEPRDWVGIYMRLVGLGFLVVGLMRACLILGITPAGENLMTMSPAWRAGLVTLVLIDLFAAVGLWIRATWGPVLWGVAILVELAMYTAFADLFGTAPVKIVVHLAAFAGFLAIFYLKWRRRPEKMYKLNQI